MINISKLYWDKCLKKIEIKNPGDSNYLTGEIVDKNMLDNNNEILKRRKKNSYSRKSSAWYH